MIRSIGTYRYLLSKIGNNNNIFLTLPVLLFIASVIEMLSIAILYPIVQSYINIEITELYDFLPKELNYKVILPLMLFSLFLFKSIYMSIVSYKKNIIVNEINRSFSNFMAKRILKFEFLDFQKLNDSEKIRLIHRESMYIGDYSTILINLISELLMTFMIALLLIINNYLLMICFFVIACIIYAFYKLLIIRVSIYSKERVKQDYIINNSLYKLVKSFKSLIIYGKSNYFINNFEKANKSKSKSITKVETIQNVQSYLMESLFMTLIASGLLLINFLNLDTVEILPMVVLFFAGLMKLLPSLNKISFYLSQLLTIEQHLNLLSAFIKDYKIIPNKEKNEIKYFKNQIIFSNINFSYNKKNVFTNLNLIINKGEIIGIKGESGVGKTTLINLLLGFISPNSGKITIDKTPLEKISNWHDIISYCDQKVFLTNESLEENIILGEKHYSKQFYESIIQKVELQTLIKDLGNNYIINESSENLSGGQVQRIGIARALFFDREIFVLDEFTSSIDTNTKKRILNNLFKERDEKTYLIVSHDQEVLEFCDKIIDLNSNER